MNKMIKVFQCKSLLMQSLVKNNHLIKENTKFAYFLTIIHYFKKVYKKNILNFDVIYDKIIKFTFIMDKMYLK